MGRRNTLLITLLLVFTMSETVFAQSGQYKRKPAPTPPTQDPKAPQQPAPQGDKVDITELEDKFWSAKDTDYSVVQNRTYTKEKRVALTAQLGQPTNDSYNSGSFTNIGLNYYLSERQGFGFEYNMFNLGNSKLVNSFQNRAGAIPDMTRQKSHIGFYYNFVPIYAKVSLLGKKILYFDFTVSPGLGFSTYEQFVINGNTEATTFAYNLDFTQHFFLSRHIAFRFDVKSRWQKEKVKEFEDRTAAQEHGKVINNDLIQTTFFVFGLTYFF